MKDRTTDMAGAGGNRSAFDQEVTLLELALVLWRYRLALVSSAVAAATVMFLIDWNRTPMFEASTKLLLTGLKAGDSTSLSTSNSQFLATYRAMINDPSLILEVATDLGLTEPPRRLTAAEALQRNVIVEAIRDTNMLLITTRLDDPALAVRFANGLAERSVKRAQQIAQDNAAALWDGVKTQLDDLHSRLEEAEQRLVTFRKQTQLEALTAEVHVLLEERAKALPLLVAIEAEKARIRQTTEELAGQQTVRSAVPSAAPSAVVGRSPGVRRGSTTEADASQLTMREMLPESSVSAVYEFLAQQLSVSRTKLSELETQRAEALRATDLTKGGAKKLNELYTGQAEFDRLKREAELARQAYVEVSVPYERSHFQLVAQDPRFQVIADAVPPGLPMARRTLRDVGPGVPGGLRAGERRGSALQRHVGQDRPFPPALTGSVQWRARREVTSWGPDSRRQEQAPA